MSDESWRDMLHRDLEEGRAKKREARRGGVRKPYDSEWNVTRAQFLEENPDCLCCGARRPRSLITLSRCRMAAQWMALFNRAVLTVTTTLKGGLIIYIVAASAHDQT
jgi:hypothetical protein